MYMAGPYVPGESFGIQLENLSDAMSTFTDGLREAYRFHYGKDVPITNQPVKEGTIIFDLYAFDLPGNMATDTLADNPFYFFINGIKLDFNLLISQPGAKKTIKSDHILLSGSSFAGIQWSIRHKTGDFAFGRKHDRFYGFVIKVPLVVLNHKNQFDLDFIMKPNAKATKYAFRRLQVRFEIAQCDAEGMENSPFEDFQSVVESKLFHQLGVDLAHKYQGKKGHCLYDKIPVVNVHLVEKEDEKASNPQCNQHF